MPTPSRVTILAFQVGFGDCFLVRFHYAGGRSRHVLVDFGSFPKASWLKDDGMRRTAKAIAAECGQKLEGVVATHRHADHVSGFTTEEDDPGSVIAACEPDVVVQPWTEDPEARRDARRPTAGFLAPLAGESEQAREEALRRGVAFVESLDLARGLAPLVEDEVAAFLRHGDRALADELAFHGQNGLGNLSAVKNLIAMGRAGSPRYVYHGADSGLEAVLPGVRVTVLGPPTLEQAATIRRYAKTAPDEYWLALARTALRMHPGGGPKPPAAGDGSREDAPAYARWLVTKLRSLRGRQLLDLVRSLDRVLNNTSVVLLFEVGDLKLLFPGDAQLENWAFALEKDDVAARLDDVAFYKVGHHGSLNATPRTMLWERFALRGRGLKTALSTLPGVHGGKHGEPTEVPRSTLVAALERESELVSTEDLPQEPGAFARIELRAS